ncbi:MAG: dihydrofolate reductase, partial [Chloroflexi bacterium]|nr:dihydrofolate reductase [Chloroflexota bacterium]
GQAMSAGMIDEVQMSVVPVLLVRGKRFFGSLTGEQRMLENPRTIEGDRVLHLIYGVRRS